MIIYCCQYEQKKLEVLGKENRTTDELHRYVNELNFRLTGFSLLGETILGWEDEDVANYRLQRMALNSTLYYLTSICLSERIDGVRYLLENKEKQMRRIIQMLGEQKSIKGRIARQVSEIIYKSTQEQPKKPKRKGFLGIFGKKEEVRPTVTIMVLHPLNRSTIAKQQT